MKLGILYAKHGDYVCMRLRILFLVVEKLGEVVIELMGQEQARTRYGVGGHRGYLIMLNLAVTT